MSTQLCRTCCLPLTLTDAELRNRPSRHPGVPAAEPELAEAEPKAAARPKAVVQMSRAAQPRARPSRNSCSYYPNGFMVPSWHHQQRG